MDYKAEWNANLVNDIRKQKYWVSWPSETISFWNRKDDRTYGERGGLTVWGWYRGAKVIRKDAKSRWWKQTVQLCAISPRKRRNANRGVKSAYEELKGNVAWREYHFRSDPRRRDNASSALVIFVPLTAGGNLSAKDDRRQRNAQDAKRNFLKQCKWSGARKRTKTRCA